jgi:predicted RNase H-like HicB family nuclease
MTQYHVKITQDDGWFIGRVLEREGVTTQGRTLDELVFMLRDAIHLMWDEKDVHLELIVPAGARTRPARALRRRRRQAA